LLLSYAEGYIRQLLRWTLLTSRPSKAILFTAKHEPSTHMAGMAVTLSLRCVFTVQHYLSVATGVRARAPRKDDEISRKVSFCVQIEINACGWLLGPHSRSHIMAGWCGANRTFLLTARSNTLSSILSSTQKIRK